jgi:hypothetical protein
VLANSLISCSRFLPLAGSVLLELSASVLAITGAACKRGVVLTLRANGLSKPVAGKRFCEAGFQNSSDKRRAAEMRCRHGPPARSSERKGFGSTLIERSLRSYFRGQAATDYRPEGLVFQLEARLGDAAIVTGK